MRWFGKRQDLQCGSRGVLVLFCELGALALVLLWPESCCTANPPPPARPALPLYILNKQYRSRLAIACNLIAFVLVVSGRSAEGCLWEGELSTVAGGGRGRRGFVLEKNSVAYWYF